MNSHQIFGHDDLWFERSLTAERPSVMLMAQIAPLEPEGPVWIQLVNPAGDLLGYVCFEVMLPVKGRRVYAATQWRPADDVSPSPQATLLLPEELFQGGGKHGH